MNPVQLGELGKVILEDFPATSVMRHLQVQPCSLTVPGTTSVLVHKLSANIQRSPSSDTTVTYTLNLNTDTIATNGGRIRKVVLGTSSISAEVLDQIEFRFPLSGLARSLTKPSPRMFQSPNFKYQR